MKLNRKSYNWLKLTPFKQQDIKLYAEKLLPSTSGKSVSAYFCASAAIV